MTGAVAWLCTHAAAAAWQCGLWVKPLGQPDWLALDVRENECVLLADSTATLWASTPRRERLGAQASFSGEYATVVRPRTFDLSKACELLATPGVGFVILRAEDRDVFLSAARDARDAPAGASEFSTADGEQRWQRARIQNLDSSLRIGATLPVYSGDTA